MDKKQFLQLVEEVCELDNNVLTGEDNLANEEIFDSIAILGLISLLDEKYGLEISVDEIMSAKTIDDLYRKVSV